MTENGLFVLGGPDTQLHDILWAGHDGKNRGRSEGEENFGELPVMLGGRVGVMRVSLVRTHVCARRWALTKPERLHYRLRVTEPERSIDPLLLTELSVIPSLLLLTKADRCCLWMNIEHCRGVDEQFLVGVDEQNPVVLPLDEQDHDRAGWRWMNRTPWRAG